MLSDDNSNAQAREAFNGSRRVLAWLARLSPQAAQYHEILSSFSDAIETYQAKLAREQQRSKVPLVERILSLDPSGGLQDPQDTTSSIIGGFDATISVPDETTPTSLSDILGTQVSRSWFFLLRTGAMRVFLRRDHQPHKHCATPQNRH